MNIGVPESFQINIFLLFWGDIKPGVELRGHIVVLFLIFEEPPYCFPQHLHQLYYLQQCMWAPFSHILTNICYFYSF